MSEGIMLNLGCGSTYRPGYINVDMHDASVADMLADVSSLPYRPDSVDFIEATQLVEHFDLAHLRYLLAEWFIILKPGADLVVETPDLSRSFKKLLRSKQEHRKTTLQWIFGIDSPGLQHKSGFTFEHLKHELQQTGFHDVTREKELTHTYEPGMRIRCTKPSDSDDKLFFARFRRRLISIPSLQNSFVLIPLEAWIEKARSAPGMISNRDRLRELVSTLAACNPIVAIALLDEMVASDATNELDVSEEIAFLRNLADARFHERAFELWTRSKKGLDVENEFTAFILRIESLIRDSLDGPGSRAERLE